MNILNENKPLIAQSSANGATLTDVLAAEIEHDGQRYVTEQANGCDRCVFYWRDGGIYDACDHPNRSMAESMCWAANRKRGINVIWQKAEAANAPGNKPPTSGD